MNKPVYDIYDNKAALDIAVRDFRHLFQERMKDVNKNKPTPKSTDEDIRAVAGLNAKAYTIKILISDLLLNLYELNMEGRSKDAKSPQGE